MTRRTLVARLAVIGWLAGACAAGGCVNTSVNTVRPANPPVVPNPEHIAKIIMNPGLEARAQVTSVFVDRDESGLLKVQANIQNTTALPGWVQYNYDWFDSKGLLIEGPAAGTARTQIRAGERANLLGLAPTAEAVDWRLTIRGL